MGTTADKLTYLNNTKSLLKDRLNSLGAEITSSTTFRNYLTWLDKFYGDASDKTDLSVNGVVGRTSQSGTPTPSTPQPINNLSGNVSYKVSGKNLFDKNNITQNKYIDINNEITDGQGWVISDYISVIANETYTYQGLTTVGTAPYSAYYDENKNLINTFKQVVGVNTITIPSNACYVRFSIRNNTENHNIDTFMIEKGSTAETYEPYIEPRTFTIPLGNIELGKITTYEDKIYSSNGKFYLEKGIGKHMFTANDNVQKASSSTDGYARCGWGTSSEIATADFSKIQVVCDKFEGVSQNDNGTSKTGIHWICSLSNTGDYKIMFRAGDSTITRENFPNFIKTNNVTVYYPLATLITTEITSSNYPALYSVLKEIQDYLTAYKINKEFILGYSSPEIEY